MKVWAGQDPLRAEGESVPGCSLASGGFLALTARLPPAPVVAGPSLSLCDLSSDKDTSHCT